MESESSHEEDEVIAEIPVFLSQELANQLYLLQYPLRPASRPYEKDLGKLRRVRVKPASKRVEFEYDLNVQSSNYDEDTDVPINKFVLSSHPVPPKTNYAVGVLRGGHLHLTPISAVCRMRPSFDHLDQAAAELKKEQEKFENEKEPKKKKK